MKTCITAIRSNKNFHILVNDFGLLFPHFESNEKKTVNFCCCFFGGVRNVKQLRKAAIPI